MIYERILINEEKLEQIINQVARRINESYGKDDSIVALVLLEGAWYFARDLLKKVHCSIQVVHLKASSYLGGTCSSGQVSINESFNLEETIKCKDVLLIDDIYDTGLTLTTVLQRLSDCNPKSVKTCVLLEKDIPHIQSVKIDFLGTTIEDAFVIGYGLDYNDQYRELPFVAVLSPKLI